MRIGMILDKSFPPDPRVENEARVLRDAGHELFLFCLDYRGVTSEESYEGIEVRRYGSSSFEYRMSALAYTIPVYSMMLKGRIRRFLNENQIDAIHVHDMVIADAVLKANASLKLPMILDLHENRPEIMAHYPHLHKFPGKYLVSIKKWKKKEAFFVEAYDRTIVVTEQARQELCERTGVSESKVIVMPNTVRPEFFSEAVVDDSISRKFSDHFCLLYLGDTGIRRGLLTAIEGLELIRNRIPEAKLVIVGANSTDAVLRDRVKQLGLEDHVSFEGWQKEDLFPSYLTGADICISPLHKNLHHDTTLANKLFQYMGFSKPILASDVTAQADILERSGSGMTHRAEDAGDFAEKCLELYENGTLRNQMGTRGKRFVEEEFNLTQVGRSLVNCYSNLNAETVK